MTQEELLEKLKRFTNDRDWEVVETLIMGFIQPLLNVKSIDPTKSNDEIASEVRGRQLSIEAMGSFLAETNMVKQESLSKIVRPKNTLNPFK